jgi:hypothetical protein
MNDHCSSGVTLGQTSGGGTIAFVCHVGQLYINGVKMDCVEIVLFLVQRGEGFLKKMRLK